MNFWIDPRRESLNMERKEDKKIGMFGSRHLQYLKEYRRVTYINLLTSGNLNSYVYEVEQTAFKRLEQIISQLAKEHGITVFA